MTNNNTNNNTQVDTWEIYDDEDKDDLFAAPSSPPPLHITESYYHIHSARPMKHEYPYLDDKKQKSILQNNIDKVTQGHFPINTKQLLSFIFRKNNILAIITVLSKIWRERTTIQKAGKAYISASVHHSMHAGHIMHHHSHRSAIAQTLLLLTALQSTSNIMARRGVRWISRSIASVGGLDSVIIALSTVAITKSVQRSERIF